MRKTTQFYPLLSVVLIGAMLIGCHVTAPTPSLAPSGAVDSIDAKANLTLQPLHAFAASVSASVQSGKLQLTQTQLDALNALNGALNIADAAEISYHSAGGGNAAALQSAVAAAVTAFNNIQSLFNSIK